MSKKNKSTENTNTIDNDSTTDSKERKTLNISLQKRNLDLLNSIIDTWDKDGLVVSNEACNCILFKYEFENNPFLQTILSRINLIKSNINSKDLYGKDYNDALNIALKNVLEIKLNPTELVKLLEDDLYFKNIDNSNSSNIKDIANTNDKNDRININNTKDYTNPNSYNSNNKNNTDNINNERNINSNKDNSNNQPDTSFNDSSFNENTNDKSISNKSNNNEENIIYNNNKYAFNNDNDNININIDKSKNTTDISNSLTNDVNKQTEEEIAVEKYTNKEDNKESKPLVWSIPKPLYEDSSSDLNEKLNAFSYDI